MRLLTLLLVLMPWMAIAAPATYGDLVARARDALSHNEPAAAADALESAQSLRPYSLGLARLRIGTLLAAHRPTEAMALAEAVAARGLALDLSGPDFQDLRRQPAFRALQAHFAGNLEPRGTSRVEWTTPDRTLLPEALGHEGEAWLVGSVRTGAIAWLTGKPRPVLRLPGGVYDIEIRGKALFAAVNDQPPYLPTGNAPRGGSLVEVDLASGTVRRAVAAGPDALFGDLEVDREGSLYASDSRTPRIAVLRPGASALTDLARDPRFVNLQGLALDENRGLLFVADYVAGLFAVDLRTGAVRRLTNPSDAHLGGIDGLYLYKGDLIGIQNGTSPQRIVRLRLDATATAVLGLKVIAQGLPQWNEPTHGIVVGRSFFYLATSNWPAYDDDGHVRDDRRLEPLRIMSVPLD